MCDGKGRACGNLEKKSGNLFLENASARVLEEPGRYSSKEQIRFCCNKK